MKNIKLFVFDLDGTLTESSETIYQTTIKTFEHFGQTVHLPKEELDKRIGEHFQTIFDAMQIHVDDVEEFINVYKTIYFDFINTTKLYPEVEDVISTLKKNGKKIALLTTKSQDQAQNILHHFKLDKYFNEIMGRRNGVEVKPSPEPLLHICNSLSVLPAQTMMIGDSELDVQCGKNAGAKTCAATYGYRPKEILIKENPDYIIKKISDLIDNL
ncbi:MAG: HAD family hydrolase [Ignavibacteriaceae bacterium]|jgi:HAD superfamily hydrolase (TIGR01549 family)|nr:HAD family hydrolase [Ignavibacteriaceae bacterium]